MNISWEQFLLTAQVVITIQLLIAVLITFFRKGWQPFLLAYAGFVLLMSYNLFLIQSISPFIAEITRFGNLIYGYLYFPVLFYLSVRSVWHTPSKSMLLHFLLPMLLIATNLLFDINDVAYNSIAIIFIAIYVLLALMTKIEGLSMLQALRLKVFIYATFVHITLDISTIYLEVLNVSSELNDFVYDYLHFPVLYTYFFVYSIFLITDIPQLKKYFKSRELIIKSWGDHELSEAARNLHEYMKREKPYLDTDINTDSLAIKVGLKKSLLNEVIRNHFNSNFPQFINEYRVNEFIEKATLEDASKYDLVGLAMESGFSSKASFYRIFKQIKGVTPSAFLASQKD